MFGAPRTSGALLTVRGNKARLSHYRFEGERPFLPIIFLRIFLYFLKKIRFSSLFFILNML